MSENKNSESSRHPLFGKDQEIIEKYRNGAGCTSLAREYGVSETSILSLLKRNNIEIRKRKTRYSIDPKEYENIKILYLQGWSSEKIGEIYEIGHMAIIKLLRELGVEIRKHNPQIYYNQETWIQTAIKIHNDEYLYDRISYQGSKEKVEIGCKDCGEYVWQEANSHIKGYQPACSCTNRYPISLEEFLIQAHEVHDDDYDYSEVTEIVNKKEKLKIKCNSHNQFFYQSYRNHLQGRGCPLCGFEKVGKANKLSPEEFFERCKNEHGDSCTYEKAVFDGFFTKEGERTKMTIFCTTPDHGYYEYWCRKHVIGYKGCPKCRKSFKSQIADEWLKLKEIPYDDEHREVHIWIGKKLYIADGYIPETKTVYEFNGAYFHGDPIYYDLDEWNDYKKCSFRTLNEKTLQKERHLKEFGYTVISKWESDWDLETDELKYNRRLRERESRLEKAKEK